MKRFTVFSLFIAGVLFFTGVDTLSAGTLSLEGQAWYVTWNSGLAKMNAQIVEAQLQKELAQGVTSYSDLASYQGLEVGDPESSGFLIGPCISYQTDDKKWEFRLSSILFGSYSTSVDSSVTVNANIMGFASITTSLPISTDLEIEYRDIDYRTTRMLTDRFGIFAGINYQSYTSELDSNYSFQFNTAGQSMSSNLSFSLDAWMAMLYAGLSYRQPFGNIFTFRGNAGAGTPVAGGVEEDLTITGTFFNNAISTDGGKVKMAFMGFAEIGLGMKLGDSVNLELGYQLRRLTVKVEKVDLNADGNADESTDETDLFHGVTFVASYLINI